MIPIALPDTLGLPVPGWVAYAFDIAFRTAFNACAGASLGAVIVLVTQRIAAPDSSFFDAINKRLIRLFPLLIIAATTLGFLPHLFKQALWGNLYLTSTLLIGSWWLGVPVAIALAFIITALLRQIDVHALPRRALLLAIALMSAKLYVLALTVSNDDLLQNPSLWVPFIQSSSLLPMLHVATFPADFVQLIAGSVAIAGIAIAAMAFVSEVGEHAAPHGFRLLLAGIALAVCVEVWRYYLSTPDMQNAMLSLHSYESIIWVTSVLAALSLVGTAILGIMHPRNPWWCVAATGQMIAVILCYNLTTLAFRAMSVHADFMIADHGIRSQPAMLIMFFVGLAMTAAAMGTICRWILPGTNRS